MENQNNLHTKNDIGKFGRNLQNMSRDYSRNMKELEALSKW